MASQTDFKKSLQPWPNAKAFSIGIYSILACVGALWRNCKGKWVQILNTSSWWGKGLDTFRIYQISPCSTITNLCLFQFVVCAGVLMTFNPSVHSSLQNKNPTFSELLWESWIHLFPFLGLQIKKLKYSPGATFICALTHTGHTKQVSFFPFGAATLCCHYEKFFIILSSLPWTQASPGTYKFLKGWNHCSSCIFS